MNNADEIIHEKTEEERDDIAICHEYHCKNKALGIKVKGSLSLFCCEDCKYQTECRLDIDAAIIMERWDEMDKLRDAEKK